MGAHAGGVLDALVQQLTGVAARGPAAAPVAAVVFDMDGVLVETEEVWDSVREDLAHATGGRWSSRAHTDMMGMSAPEWTGYMHRVVGVALPPDEIGRRVVARLGDRYRQRLPMVPGAAHAVRSLAAHLPLAVASSSNRELIDLVLDLAGLRPLFRAWVASEEVARGKPAPDVYLEAARRLGVPPARCAAVEDSGAGIRAAADAGMWTVAVPNRRYPPDAAALARAGARAASVAEVPALVLARAAAGGAAPTR